MKRPKTQLVRFRRKREGRTNYKKRFLQVASGRPRLVIRATSTQVIVQLISFDPKGDIVLAGVNSTVLKKQGWKGSVKNIPSAYAAGFLLGQEAIKKGHKEAIVDIGFHTNLAGAKVYATVKGAIDAGMEIPCSEEMFPSEERLKGTHIKGFANAIDTKVATKEKKNE